MKQELIDEFTTIYQNNLTQKLLPYLQKLTAKERKELVSLLRPHKDVAHKKGNKGIYYAAALACCTRKQFQTFTEWYYGDIPQLADEILAWYCPEWLSEHYNDERVWGALAYKCLLRWQLKGYLHPSDSLIARSLAIYPRKYDKEKKDYIFDLDFADSHPIILDEHIWKLFVADSSIHYQDNYRPKEEGVWTRIFKKYISSGQLSRLKVLKACLLTINYEFSRDNIGWFASLFTELKPTPEELLALQDELFGTFPGKYTKPVNRALDAIKTIADHPEFQVETFLTHLTVLLSSEVKATVQSTLMILAKIAAKHPNQQTTICTAVTLVFLNKDESIQTRAAKLIVQYGDPTSETVRSAVNSYREVMLMSIKDLLKDYLEEHPRQVADAPTEESIQPLDMYAKENRIQPIETVEDLIFFLSGVFDQNEPIHLDLLPEALIRLNPQINASHLPQFEIALQKAYAHSSGDPFWPRYHHTTKEWIGNSFWGTGLFRRMLALFFINYGQYLQQKYPVEGAFIGEMHKEALKATTRWDGKYFTTNYLKIAPMHQWYGMEFDLLQPYIHILIQALEFIEKGISLPLLSTPTHAPAWIEPSVWEKRFNEYQQAGVSPDTMDLQLSLSRCTPYFEESPVYESLSAHCQTYSWKIADTKQADATYTERPVLEMLVPESPWQSEHSLYSGIGDNIRRYISPEDAQYLCYMFPSMPAIPYALLLKDRFEFAQMADAQTRDMLTDAIVALHQLKTAQNPATTLFLACSLLCSERNIRNYAAEIWMERTSHALINNTLLGQTLGWLISAEWAPVKRFTDMVTRTLLAVGQTYYVALEELLTSTLMQIDKPVTNLKKLLEIYNELLALNSSVPQPGLLSRLNTWGTEQSLKKIIRTILSQP